jgi:hypothetical protein
LSISVVVVVVVKAVAERRTLLVSSTIRFIASSSSSSSIIFRRSVFVARRFQKRLSIIVVEKSERWHFFWLVVHISREPVTSSASSVVCDCANLRHHEHPLPFRHAHHRPCISLLATQTHTTSFHHDRKPHKM